MFGVVIHHLYVIIIGTMFITSHSAWRTGDTVVICNSHTNVTCMGTWAYSDFMIYYKHTRVWFLVICIICMYYIYIF